MCCKRQRRHLRGNVATPAGWLLWSWAVGMGLAAASILSAGPRK